MLHILNYERPQTLEEAYQLRQKKGSAVLGGTGWLRLGEHTLRTAIDLSGLGLRYIKDEGDSFLLGAYTTLRDLETSAPLNEAFGGAFAVHGIRVIESDKGRFISMPQDSYKKNGETKYNDTFHAITAEARNALVDAVNDAYEQKLQEQQEQKSGAPDQAMSQQM